MNKKKLFVFFNKHENIIVLALVVLTLLSIVTISSEKNTYNIERKFRYSFTLQNKTSQVLKNVDFWAYAPVKETSNQKTKGIEASHKYKLASDELGNQVLHFKIPHLAPYGSKIIKLESTLLLSPNPVKQVIQSKLLFLQAEKYVEVDDPSIKKVAERFQTSDKESNARNVMNWVNKNISYAGYIENDRGALYALNANIGDCTEYMYLYTAIMRNQNIPTRNMGGYVYSENTVLKPEDFHNWSEIYLDGKWQVVDPQNGKFLEKQNNYVAFRIISNKIDKKLTPTNSQRFAISNKNISVKIN